MTNKDLQKIFEKGTDEEVKRALKEFIDNISPEDVGRAWIDMTLAYLQTANSFQGAYADYLVSTLDNLDKLDEAKKRLDKAAALGKVRGELQSK